MSTDLKIAVVVLVLLSSGAVANAAHPLDLELAYSHKELRARDAPDLSPDGRWLACEVYTPPEQSPGEPRYLPNGTPAGVVGIEIVVTNVADGTSRPVVIFGEPGE